MDYLDIPRPMSLSERSPSQTNFVIEEDGVSEYGDSNAGDNSIEINIPPPSRSRLLFLQTWAPGIIGVLLLLCISLAIALTTLIILYSKTFPPFELCPTKACKDTATLFLRSMDSDADPCEDFHKFSCGRWIEETASVTSRPMYDHTTAMRDRTLTRLRSLTESINMNDIPALHQLKYIYDSCVDLESIEKAGLKPLVRFVREFLPHSSNLSMGSTLGKIRRITGQSYLIDLRVSVDSVNTSYNSIFLDSPDLPVDSDTMDSSDEILEAYKYLIQSVATILSREFPEETIFQELVDNVQVIVDWETELSNGMTDEDDLTKPQLYNVMTVRELNGIFAENSTFELGNSIYLKFNWTEYLSAVFEGFPIDDSSTVIVNDVGYVHALAKFFNSIKRIDFNLYLSWQLLYTMGKDVTSEVRGLFNRFTAKVDGKENLSNRRTACISMLDDKLSFLITYKYILKYMDHAIIDEAEGMAQRIITAFKLMVSELDWMDDTTKSKAMEKADHVRKYFGYPAWLRNAAAVQKYYTGLSFTNSFFHNVVTLMEWLSVRDLRSAGQPVDISWPDLTDSPAEANAFYVDELNAITFPAGFLQQPFIGMGLRAADYGALGAVIGHELTHGFDTTGRYCDAFGRLSYWWSGETLRQFVEKTQCFIHQYDLYRFPELESLLGDNDTVNGKQTLAENIADNGGIREALRAYRSYVEEQGEEGRLPGLEQYTPEQLFFLSFAQSWCAYMSPKALADLLLTNVHSPAKFRIIGPLSNFQDFSSVWQCKSGSRMNPKNKCVLW